jgi:maltose alpha-D-glucosyltransferase/alpha-amylase
MDRQPLWYKDAVIYQLHVRAYADSNGDGIGDFAGLAGRLDYIRDLGANTIWLLPFYPSPLRDDGYDIADYTDVNPAYGTLADFKAFLREAHDRGLRVITELVMNHTSDQHAWFQRARRAPKGSPERDFYVWSDTPDKYQETRIIFKDYEASNWTWDPVAQQYFWHRFFHHQPDLNFENPLVVKALYEALDFWFEMGVDGLRLDAIPYLHEKDGTSNENLPETHEELKKLRAHVDSRFRSRMLLAEANQWPEDAVAYFGQGDECHMAFHFPLMPRMFMAVRMEDRYPIVDILAQTPAIPEGCQWAIFLRNHDELTLEMVTDEERDYMYRVYANDPQARINLGIRRRLSPLLGNDRRRVELMNGLLFSLPGTPVMYYGDEIGMGDNIYLGDRNGVRTPMQWSGDQNAGFSQANPQRLYLPCIIGPHYSYEAVNVRAQQDDPSSLLWWTRRLISVRKRFASFGRGSLEFLYASNRRVLAFVRRHESETVLVVANLSRFAQAAEIDLSAFREQSMVEVFGQTEFPRITERPYVFSLAPYAFYWLQLSAPSVAETRPERPRLTAGADWRSILRGRGRAVVEQALPAYLGQRRWFGGKARKLKSAEIMDLVALGTGALAFVHVDYVDADPETYVLNLSFARGEAAAELERNQADAIFASLTVDGVEGVLHGAPPDRAMSQALLDVIARRRSVKGLHGELRGAPTRALRALRTGASLEPSLLRAEQSNTSIVYGDRLILKLVRRAEPGVNPDLEISTALSERTSFRNIPGLAGHLEYLPRGTAEPIVLGILQARVANEGDAWEYTLDSVQRFFDRVLTSPEAQGRAVLPAGDLLELAAGELPLPAHSLIGTYLESARLLAQRTAEMHLALASLRDEPAFAPEPFTPFYQRSLYQSMRNLAEQASQLVRRRAKELPDDVRPAAERLLAAHPDLLRRLRTLADRKVTAMRTRIHGDYHLGQVLRTGRDFVIIDFEGEPALPLSTRRIKRSPLRDVAGMIRSFDYAAHQGLNSVSARSGPPTPEESARLRSYAQLWSRWVSSAFLRAYLRVAQPGGFLPSDPAEVRTMLTAYLLEKAVYELVYELNNRPDWVRLPLQGILSLLEEAPHEPKRG